MPDLPAWALRTETVLAVVIIVAMAVFGSLSPYFLTWPNLVDLIEASRSRQSSPLASSWFWCRAASTFRSRLSLRLRNIWRPMWGLNMAFWHFPQSHWPVGSGAVWGWLTRFRPII